MTFVLISFALGSQHKSSFQWNMCFKVLFIKFGWEATLKNPYPHCTNFVIYKTIIFHVNMPKDQLSSPLLGIYFTFPFKSKGLKGDLFVIFT